MPPHKSLENLHPPDWGEGDEASMRVAGEDGPWWHLVLTSNWILILVTLPAHPDPDGLIKTPADQQDPNSDPDPYLDPGLRLLLKSWSSSGSRCCFKTYVALLIISINTLFVIPIIFLYFVNWLVSKSRSCFLIIKKVPYPIGYYSIIFWPFIKMDDLYELKQNMFGKSSNWNYPRWHKVYFLVKQFWHAQQIFMLLNMFLFGIETIVQ